MNASALACLVAYCDYRPIVISAVAISLHHFALNFMLPAAIYPGGADFGRAMLHAVIVAMESGVLIWLARKLADLFETGASQDIPITTDIDHQMRLIEKYLALEEQA